MAPAEPSQVPGLTVGAELMAPAEPSQAPSGVLVVVVMGIAGSGKTTIGRLLAARLGWEFLDGDGLHPPANVTKMAAGHPLTEADRGPWIAAIATWIRRQLAAGRPGVVACSSLKRSHRERLRADGVLLAHLLVAPEIAKGRVAGRSSHFMPATLVDSQVRDLEPPEPDEGVLNLDGERPSDEIIDRLVRALRVP